MRIVGAHASAGIGRRDNGISIGQNSSVVIYRSVIAGASVGTAVFDSSYAFIDHATFYDNDTAVSCNSKSSESGCGTVEIVNSILSHLQYCLVLRLS